MAGSAYEPYWPELLALVVIYFVVCGIFTLRYAFKTRNNPEKKGNPKFFKNEVIIACLLFFNAAVFPIIFDNIVLYPDRTHQAFTFIGMEALINLLVWVILISYWKIENYVFWKYIVKRPQRTYDEWKEKINTKWKDSPIRDIIRKLIHFAYLPLVLVFWLKFRNGPNDTNLDWTGLGLAVYYQANILYGFLIVMVIFDLLRLSHWKLFGMLPRFWAECTIKTSELNTFNSSSPLILSVMPFIFFGPQIFWCVALVAPISDAMASIIGKNFGKKRPGHNKTVAGFIAGAVTSYIFTILVHIMTPFDGIDWLEINCIAAGVAFAFYLVDRYVVDVTDNFANPVVVGIVLVVLTAIFRVI